MNIILIGFKSSGKTTTGMALAKQLNWAFVDTDQLLEQRHTVLHHETLHFREIFRQYGRDYFLKLEAQVVAELPQLQEQVIAVGGGTFINQVVSSELRQTARLVYLQVTPQILWQRIMNGGIPAFFTTDDPETEFYNLFQQRAPIYQKLADYKVTANHNSPTFVAQKILQQLGLKR